MRSFRFLTLNRVWDYLFDDWSTRLAKMGLKRRAVASRKIPLGWKPSRFTLETLEDRITPDGRPLPLPFVFVGSASGAPPLVRAYHADTGELAYERTPFDAGFTGGVRVAAGDINHDGIPDLIAAAGPGAGPHVRIFDGITGDQIAGPLGSFYAYDPEFTGGVYVAGGDVDGDTWADLITASGAGGGPHIKVFSGQTGLQIDSFYAFDSAFRGGATIAAADFNGDGRAEVAVGAGAGAGPHVKVFDLQTHDVLAGPLGSFMAFDAGVTGGVDVGTDFLAGDVTGDGRPDLVVGAGPGTGSRVQVYDGVTGALVADFSPFGAAMTAGVRVSTAYVDDDPRADIIVGTGPGPTATVKVFSGLDFTELASPMSGYAPFGSTYTGGLFVAGSNDPHYAYALSSVSPRPTVMVNGTVTLTETLYDLDSSDGYQIPTGTVTFYSYWGGNSIAGPRTTLGTALAVATGVAGQSKATLILAPFPLGVGNYTLTADYSGDDWFFPITQGMVEYNYQVTSPPPPPTTPGSISDFVWWDQNSDGQQSNGEPGIKNVVVKLYKLTPAQTYVSQTTTDNAGKYAFNGLTPGTYQVKFENPDPNQYVATTRYVGSVATDSNADVDGWTGAIVIAANTIDTTIDGGFAKFQIIIVGDTNRDGSVTDADLPDRDKWSNKRGAIYAVNHDDNDLNGKQDAVGFADAGVPVDENFAFENQADADQSAPLVIKKTGVLPAGMKVFLKVADADQARAIHVFNGRTPGAIERLGALVTPGALEVDITTDVSATADTTFGLEGLLYRYVGANAVQALAFNGYIDFTLELRRADATVVRSDNAKLKVAPWVMMSNQQASREVWAQDAGAANASFRLTASADPGYVGLDNATGQLKTYNLGTRWAQDHAEIGYTQRPGGDKLYATFQLPYGNQPNWVKDNLLGVNSGVFQLGSGLPQGDSGDFGGNLELMPPNANNKLGRIVVGDRMSATLQQFLTSQEVQPLTVLPTKWLAVGHVDEMISFDPVKPNTVLIASPTSAYALLKAIPIADRGEKMFFGLKETKAGVVTQNATTDFRIDTGIDHTAAGAKHFMYVRIYDDAASGSGAAGQIAKISAWDNGFVTVSRVWNTTSRLVPTANVIGSYMKYATRVGTANTDTQWFSRPKLGDKFVLIENSLESDNGANPTPVAITVQEVLADAGFETLNTTTIKTILDSVKTALNAASGANAPLTFVEIPDLFFGNPAAPNFNTGKSSFAFSPGLANAQFLAGKSYFARSYAPVVAGKDIFEDDVVKKVGSTAVFVEDWEFYHDNTGEVHCGSLVKRDFLTDKWWVKLT